MLCACWVGQKSKLSAQEASLAQLVQTQVRPSRPVLSFVSAHRLEAGEPALTIQVRPLYAPAHCKLRRAPPT